MSFLKSLHPSAPAVMGVVNVTPDSFSDGGAFFTADCGRRPTRSSWSPTGAELLDIGGESTRPGAEPVSADEELSRVLPVLERVALETPIPISVDTMKSVVADQALRAGAAMINDVTALRGDPQMAAVVAEAGVPVCLMHMLGEPRTMQDDPRYDDVLWEVTSFLAERAEYAISEGIERDNICVDPGIGFGKTVEHNLALLRGLPTVVELGFPVVVGVSRKRFLGALTGAVERDRLAARLAPDSRPCSAEPAC